MSNSAASASQTTNDSLWTIRGHLKICYRRYITFFVAYALMVVCGYLFTNWLPESGAVGNVATVSDLAQSMLSLCALTVPLLLAYIMHPHQSLYVGLASHLENMLGAVGVYKNDINNISTSAPGQSKTLEPMVEACVWIIRHNYYQAKGEELSSEGKGWLFNPDELIPFSDLDKNKDKTTIAFYILVIGLLIVLLFSGLFFGSYKNTEFIRPFIVSTSLVALVLNLVAYCNVFIFVVRRLTLKNKCIWKIDTHYNRFESVIISEVKLLEAAKTAATDPRKDLPKGRARST